MNKTTGLTFGSVLGRSFVSSITLALVESVLMLVIRTSVQIVLYGNNSGLAGVNPFVSIISNVVFVLMMRALLGFTLFNMTVWCLIAFVRRRISLPTICFVNGMSIMLMYCAWDWNYQIFHSFFYVKDFSDLFGLYQMGLLCSLLSPVIAYRITFVPNILPLLLKTQHEHDD